MQYVTVCKSEQLVVTSLQAVSPLRWEVGVHRVMSKHSSDHYVLFFSIPCHRCVIMHELDEYKDIFKFLTTI